MSDVSKMQCSVDTRGQMDTFRPGIALSLALWLAWAQGGQNTG